MVEDKILPFIYLIGNRAILHAKGSLLEAFEKWRKTYVTVEVESMNAYECCEYYSQSQHYHKNNFLIRFVDS